MNITKCDINYNMRKKVLCDLPLGFLIPSDRGDSHSKAVPPNF